MTPLTKDKIWVLPNNNALVDELKTARVITIKDVKEVLDSLKRKIRESKICCVYQAGDDHDPCDYTIGEVLRLIDEEFPAFKEDEE